MTMDAIDHGLRQRPHYGGPRRILDTYRGQADCYPAIPSVPSYGENSGHYYFARIAINDDDRETHQHRLAFLEGSADLFNLQLTGLMDKRTRYMTNAEDKETLLGQTEREIENGTGYSDKVYHQDLYDWTTWDVRLGCVEIKRDRSNRKPVSDFAHRASEPPMDRYLSLITVDSNPIVQRDSSSEKVVARHASGVPDTPITPRAAPIYGSTRVLGSSAISLSYLIRLWARRPNHHLAGELNECKRV